MVNDGMSSFTAHDYVCAIVATMKKTDVHAKFYEMHVRKDGKHQITPDAYNFALSVADDILNLDFIDLAGGL